MPAAFIPGRELSRLFFVEAVEPRLARDFRGLRYAAALLGSGSEVLGFDTEMSTDHDWGPRVDLFLLEEDHARVRDPLDAMLRTTLPHTFRGYATSFSDPDPTDNGTRLPEHRDAGPVRHKIDITTPGRFFTSYLAFDGTCETAPADWLTFSEQKLRTIATGPIFHDEIGLTALRDRFAYYPRDVWLYQLSAAWTRISQEEHLMGRAGFVGDEIGSALIGARLVRDVMRLAFLMERQYAPYPKWFGTAFAQLACGPRLSPHLTEALAARRWQDRERHLVAAYEIAAAMHDALGITPPMPTIARSFFNRPFRVMALHGFADAIAAQITDPVVQAIAARPRIGGIDLLSDSTDLVSDESWRPTLTRLFHR